MSIGPLGTALVLEVRMRRVIMSLWDNKDILSSCSFKCAESQEQTGPCSSALELLGSGL
jgi:hypothetical protein